QEGLHAMKSAGCLGEAWLLFECLAIVTGGFEIFLASFVSAAEVEMGKGVGFITRRIEGAFEPAHAAVGVAFGQQIAANIVVRVSQRFIDTNRFQTFLN